MRTEDYKRFLNFLRKHNCHMPFHLFRCLPARAVGENTAPTQGSEFLSESPPAAKAGM
jgi:hypothetical protein